MIVEAGLTKRWVECTFLGAIVKLGLRMAVYRQVLHDVAFLVAIEHFIKYVDVTVEFLEAHHLIQVATRVNVGHACFLISRSPRGFAKFHIFKTHI